MYVQPLTYDIFREALRASAGAFIVRENTFFLGTGDFTSTNVQPNSGAFYSQTFALDSPQPWKIPSLLYCTSFDTVKQWLQNISTHYLHHDRLEWEKPNKEHFQKIFSEIIQKIHQGQLLKAVPVVKETAHISSPEEMNQILEKLRIIVLQQASSSHYPYAYWSESEGFLGVSPELLFSLNENFVRTLALAGTDKVGNKDEFILDPKEIQEHEFVSQTIQHTLSPYGSIRKSSRHILQIQQLIHFQTDIEVELHHKVSPDKLVHLLHPTPALGPLPKTCENLSQLNTWRNEVSIPRYFGAPFGLLIDNNFTSIIAIRGGFHSNCQIDIPSGCGVIAESIFSQEWQELALKRLSVKNCFTL